MKASYFSYKIARHRRVIWNDNFGGFRLGMSLAHDHLQWTGSGSTRRWRAEGISAKKPRLERWMEKYFQQKVAELRASHQKDGHTFVTENHIMDFVSNRFVRQVADPRSKMGGKDENKIKTVWQISHLGMEEFKELVAKEREEEKNDRNWVSWAYFFKEKNISCTQDAIEREIQRFGDYKTRQFVMEDGMSPDNAKREVEMDWVRVGKNRFRNLVWQVRRDKVDQYMDWHREEERWINPTMGVRCRELGIYHDDHGIEHVLPDLFRREVSYLTQDGMEEEKARYEVEKHKCRIGTNTRNDISWQFHEGYASVLNKRMEFLTPSLLVAAVRNFHHYSDPQDGDRWIDSLREKARQKRYGQIRHILENVSLTQGEFFGREKISEAIESIYAQEVEKRRANGMSWAAATREVEENIAVYGYNFKGGLSWQFDVSSLPNVLEKLNEMEEERKSWCSASHTMLKARKIADNQDIVNLALAYLYNKEIDDRVSNGMVRADVPTR